MIETTSENKRFFDDEDSPIYIYGAANSGQWTAWFMERDGMDFKGFIDGHVEGDLFKCGKPMINTCKLSSVLGKKRTRIIITRRDREDALSSLRRYAEDCDLLCLVPRTINEMLSYFRRKRVIGFPTILANNCTASIFYYYLGLTPLTPTIYTDISQDDFVKLCKEPRKYLSEDIQETYWSTSLGEIVQVGKLYDIEIIFAHYNGVRDPSSRWNQLRKWVNWDNICYIMTDSWGARVRGGSFQSKKEFDALPGKHLRCVSQVHFESGPPTGNVVYHTDFLKPEERDIVVENFFDLVGWINGEF